ncbi:MAG: hypothetical protein DMG32_20160 [Acidobacteria bacterium]|nr:MAG: hypothetical protein DMG32_20160 [Acidobacteriota bacterium]
MSIGAFRIGAGEPLVLIAGPCVIENERHALKMAERLVKIAAKAKVPLIFKASYDKANRSSVRSFRGPGLAGGLEILREIKARFRVPGYNNLVVDMRSFPILAKTGCPVVFDVTHSVQLPGGQGNASGGEPEFIEPLARAGTAVGVDGIFLEVHERPERALSDGSNALRLDRLPGLLAKLKPIAKLVRSWSLS